MTPTLTGQWTAGSLALRRLVRESPADVALARTVLAGSTQDDLRARFGRLALCSLMLEWLLPRTGEDLALVAVTMPEAGAVGLLNANVVRGGVRELAVLVVGPWQRRGVGTVLVRSARELVPDVLVGTIGGSNLVARRALVATAPDVDVGVAWGEVEFEIPAWMGAGRAPSRYDGDPASPTVAPPVPPESGMMGRACPGRCVAGWDASTRDGGAGGADGTRTR